MGNFRNKINCQNGVFEPRSKPENGRRCTQQRIDCSLLTSDTKEEAIEWSQKGIHFNTTPHRRSQKTNNLRRYRQAYPVKKVIFWLKNERIFEYNWYIFILKILILPKKF